MGAWELPRLTLPPPWTGLALIVQIEAARQAYLSALAEWEAEYLARLQEWEDAVATLERQRAELASAQAPLVPVLRPAGGSSAHGSQTSPRVPSLLGRPLSSRGFPAAPLSTQLQPSTSLLAAAAADYDAAIGLER
jgi:hypothetical protein